MTNQIQTENKIREILDSYFKDKRDAHNAAIQIASMLEQSQKKMEEEAYSRMASTINSHGFIGLMTGEYELKEIQIKTQIER